MATDGSPLDSFKAFYEDYCRACKSRDAAFLRKLLPGSVPDDEFAFVLEMSRQSMEALEASGVTPTLAKTNDRVDVVYQGDLGDGMTEFTIDFYFHDGQWLKYDPSLPPEAHGPSLEVGAAPPPEAPPAPGPTAFVPGPDQAVAAPASTDRASITPLGYLEARDVMSSVTYALAPYVEEQVASGKWRLRVSAKGAAATNLDPAHPSFRSNMAKAAVKGEDSILVGASIAPKEGDPRCVETRVHFDENLTPLRVAMRLVARNADGSATEPQVLTFPWPAPAGGAAGPAQVVEPPKSSTSVEVEQLAYLNGYDVVADKDYGFVAYKETRPQTGNWVLKIKAKSTAGASLDPSHPSFVRNVETAAKKGEDHVVFGFRMEPKEDDPRRVENRLYFDGSLKPTRVDMHLVVRKADGSAREEQVASFPWPA